MIYVRYTRNMFHLKDKLQIQSTANHLKMNSFQEKIREKGTILNQKKQKLSISFKMMTIIKSSHLKHINRLNQKTIMKGQINIFIKINKGLSSMVSMDNFSSNIITKLTSKIGHSVILKIFVSLLLKLDSFS